MAAFRKNAGSIFVVLGGQACYYAEILESGHIAGDGIRRHDFAQQAAHDFAAAGFGERIGEADLLRLGEAADFVTYPLAQLFSRIQ
jgi:hypothetical protein